MKREIEARPATWRHAVSRVAGEEDAARPPCLRELGAGGEPARRPYPHRQVGKARCKAELTRGNALARPDDTPLELLQASADRVATLRAAVAAFRSGAPERPGRRIGRPQSRAARRE